MAQMTKGQFEAIADAISAHTNAFIGSDTKLALVTRIAAELAELNDRFDKGGFIEAAMKEPPTS